MERDKNRILGEVLIEDFKQQLPGLLINISLIAKLYKGCFSSLLKEGFTDQQALEITIKRGPYLINADSEGG